MGLLFLIYPFVEIYAYYKFIEAYSFMDALLLAIGSAALGLFILTTIGRSALQQIQGQVATGAVPANAVLHRGMIMFGGLLFFVPGLVNDVAGFLFVMPGTRHLLLIWLKAKLARGLFNGRVFVSGFGFPGGARGGFTTNINPDFRSEDERFAEARDATVIDIKPLSSNKKDQP